MVTVGSSEPRPAPVLELRDVSVRFGQRAVFSGLSLEVGSGECVGVLGVNGSGKTTLLRLASGLMRPTSGERRGPRRVAYVPAAFEPPPMAAGSWLKRVNGQRRKYNTINALDQMGFDGRLNQAMGALSFGNLRKLALVDALTSDCPFVAIDEAHAGLDDRGIGGLHELITANLDRGVAALISDQDSQTSGVAHRFVRLGDGEVPAPKPAGTTITFAGPAANRQALVNAAERLGFRAHVPR